MLQVSANTFIDACEVALIKLTDRKTIYIVLKNKTEVETKSTTEEKTETLFRQIVVEINALQRQAIK